MSGTITQPPKASPGLKTAAGRRKLIGKTVDQVLYIARGYQVACVYPEDIGVKIGKSGRVEAVW